ncbi:MAG: AAA family ATPase [Pseudomonadota bacterium]
MPRRRSKTTNQPAPYLRRVWVDADDLPNREAYPFVLPFLKDGFELLFQKSITVIAGENGVGKSTLIEAIAALAGYDSAGGGKGYVTVDHSRAIETNGEVLGDVLKAAWLPRVTNGWFFRAESFFSVARYLDDAGPNGPDYLSHSHGEGFMRFFEERCMKPGVYFFDEPEAALSPARQVEFLKLLRTMHRSEKCQVIMATHSPILMSLPEFGLLRMHKYGLDAVRLEDTDHFRMWRDFCENPQYFLEAMIDD